MRRGLCMRRFVRYMGETNYYLVGVLNLKKDEPTYDLS